MLGKTLSGRYQIIKHLGGGGFGQTYLAEDRHKPGNPLCVVKQLQPKSKDPDTLQIARRLFDREAQVLYRLGNHDQIPRFLAHFEEDEEFYLVQEFIEGDELTREVPVGKQLSETQVVALLQEILKILEFVHQQDVIHRDIKPSNIIRRFQDDKLVLIDFGAVKQVSTQTAYPEGQTSLTVAIGSPGYMANEQLVGKPRFCSDIYAVGMLGIQAITGVPASQLPEDPITSEIIWRDRVQVSQHLVYVLDTMVRYDYRQRYQTATQALQAIEQLTNPELSTQPYNVVTRKLSPPVALTQPTVTATVPLQTAPFGQPTVSLSAERSVLHVGSPNDHDRGVATSRKKSLKLVGIATGIAAALALTTGIFYLTKPNTLLAWVLARKQNISLANTLTGHSKEVLSVAISLDGQTLASGSYDNTIKVWNLPKGKQIRTLSGHSSKVKSVAFSPDGQILASGSWDGTIKLWNRSTGKLLQNLPGHSGGVVSVTISPDGQTLASSGADKTIKLWNLHTGKLLRTLSGHSGWVYSVAFSPDGQTLANGSDDKTIKLWHLPTGSLISSIPDPSGNVVRSVAFSPDGQILASGSFNTINLWHLRNLLFGCKVAQSCVPTRTLKDNLGIVESIAISPDGQTIAAGSKNKTINLWNMQTGEVSSTLSNIPGKVDSLTFSPDGKTLVSSGSQDGTIEIWR